MRAREGLDRTPGRPGGDRRRGASLLRVLAGVGFVNYDTLYALAWGGQLSRGETPAYGVPIAPTPHPLIEILGVVLAPLGPRGRSARDRGARVPRAVGVRAGWSTRSARTGSGAPPGRSAALLLLTRVPVLSYGVRAYVDIPYLLLVLSALLVESRRPRAGCAGARRCSRSPGCCAPRRGCSRGSTGCT